MLESLTFTRDWRCFKCDTTFTFKSGVNLLVGDQGCGKSSLLLEISQQKYSKVEVAKKMVTYRFDFERDNLRVKTACSDNVAAEVASRFMSHGEANKVIFDNLSGVKDSIIFQDEPDMALSIRSAYTLARWFEELAKRGNQIIVAVHNPIVISYFQEVLSLEHQQWMSSQDFIQSHTEEA